MHSRTDRVWSQQRTQHKPTFQIFIHEQTTRGSCFPTCHLSSTFQLIVFSELHSEKYIKRNDRLTLKKMLFDSCCIEEKRYKIVSMKITCYLYLCFHVISFQFLEFV